MSSNGGTIVDNYGDASDWLEVFNDGPDPFPLGGCYLSDDPANPLRWQIPAGEVPSGGFLLIWATGRNEMSPGGHLHASFSISAAGEPLRLTAADGTTLLDQAPAVALGQDWSYGRAPGQPNIWHYFDEPTPGAANANTGQELLLGVPSFSLAGGWHAGPIQVELSSPDSLTEILFTLDGSEPHPDALGGETHLVNYFFPGQWTVSQNLEDTLRTYVADGPISLADRSSLPNHYSNIITSYSGAGSGTYLWAAPAQPVTKATVLRARLRRGASLGPVATQSYFFHPSGQNPHNLPVVAIAGDPRDVFGYDDGVFVPGRVYFQSGGTETNYVTVGNFTADGRESEIPAHGQLFGADGLSRFAQNLGLRIHGGGSRSVPRKGYGLYARTEFDGPDRFDLTLFPDQLDAAGNPINSHKNMLIRNGGNIMNEMRDRLAHGMMEGLRIEFQKQMPAVQYVNGEYWGLGAVCDLNDEHFLEAKYGLDPDNCVILNAPFGLGTPAMVDEGLPEDLQLYQALYNFVVANDLSDDSLFAQAEQMVDLDSYIDYNLAFIYLRNVDWYGAAHFRYWRARQPQDDTWLDGKWRFMVWDFDATFISPSIDFLVNFIHPTGGGTGYNAGSAERTALLRGLLENDGFRQRFINRFADLINTTFQPTVGLGVLNQIRSELDARLAAHQARWSRAAYSTYDINQCTDFINQRPAFQRQHIVSNFGLPGTGNVVLDVSDASQGHVEINTVSITPATPGVPDPAYPWTGVYFRSVPVEVRAVAEPGFRFARWLESGSTDNPLAVLPDSLPQTFTAVFEADVEERQVVQAWHFNALPGGALATVVADQSLVPGGQISYPGTGAGYLDAVNEGSGLGALPETPAGSALRVRNPSSTRELRVAAPSTGHEDLALSYAVMRTSSGAQAHRVQARPTGSSPWQVVADSVVVAESFQLVELDLAGWPGLANQAGLELRFLFLGSNASGTSGNQRFDNLTLTGVELPAVNLPPAVTAPLSLQHALASGAALEIDLSGVFTDPEGDPLAFTAASSDSLRATVQLSGDVLELLGQGQGDAWITVTAGDGVNAPVAHSFRVLVHPAAATLPVAFAEWAATEPERSHPAHMLFLQGNTADPGSSAALEFPYFIAHDDYHADDAGVIGFPYMTTGRSRINGLGTDGIAFINTGRDRDLGGALLALDTRGQDSVKVSWLAGTVLPNSRVYGLRLQVRTSPEAAFTDLLLDGQPVEYVRNAVAGHSQAFGPLALPDSLLGREHVELLWRYFHVSGSSGARAQLRLDDILVQGGAAPAAPVVAIQTQPDGRVALSWDTLPGAWEYEVRRGGGWPGTSFQPVAVTTQAGWTDPDLPGAGETRLYQVLRRTAQP